MEGLSIAANGLAVVSVAIQLTEACVKLYRFWESVEDAPQEIASIKEDLQYLISIFQRIESKNNPTGDCIAEGVQHCRIKVWELTAIIEKFDVGFHSLSRRSRKWAAFKAVTQTKHIERFRASLSETKATLTLALVHQCVVQSQQPTYSLSKATNTFHSSEYGSLTLRTSRSMSSERFSVDDAVADQGSNVHERSQCITSFVFYPTKWVQQLGIRNGIEAVMASAGQSWLFNCRLTVTRAVPEDSLIFELCRTGQTRAVEILLNKRMGSVVDTSPKGWKPLHFAAAGGHVELCAMSIEAGADKTALVYEGPSTSILSPISIFVACAGELHAEVKISMLRLFSECIDLADSNGDGWTVHEWLKKTYAREKVPISQNSITWLLHSTANEEFVEFTSRRIWSALQHAVRTVLCHQRHGRLLERILDLSDKENEAICQPAMDAIGLLMALRVIGRVLLPMIVTAASFLQIRGLDWVKDDITHRQYLQALPTIYTAWCHALLDCVGNVEAYMRLEVEQCLQRLGWSRDLLLNAVSQQNRPAKGHDEELLNTSCMRCNVAYNSLPGGLVVPTRIAISECIRTSHGRDCECQKYYNSDGGRKQFEPPEFSGVCLSDTDIDSDSDAGAEEEFYDAVSFPNDNTILQDQKPSDIFWDAALLLYRSQGREWMGTYEVGEHLCATCFLLEERYTDEDGLIAEFPPMPDNYIGLRFTW